MVKYSTLVIAVLLLSTVSGLVFSGELAGQWVSDVDAIYKTKARTVYEFNVDGSKLTGSVLGGLREEERSIVNGKIKGNKISFAVPLDEKKHTLLFLYKGTITGDTINFVVTYGSHTRAKFTARKLNQ